MTSKLDKYVLKNGMVILGEPMEGVGSAAFDFMLPCGGSMYPDGCRGAGSVISDWIFRGAGGKDSIQLSDALDGLGLHRAGSVNSSHISIGASLEAGNLSEAINLYSDVILSASLDDEQFRPAKQLSMDSVLGLDDDPRRKVMIELRERFYPEPLGRSTLGTVPELQALTAETARSIIAENFNISGTIFGVAGKYDFGSLCSQLEKYFETSDRKPLKTVVPGKAGGKYTHLPNGGAQVHIGLMTPCVLPTDEDYYNARVAVSVLSGGMSARLFTEVREKRGLCYAVGARYQSLKEAAGISCYAGTTPDKAQETLDVILGEFRRLKEGISEEEINIAKVGLKSSLIMQSESSSSRAGSLGSDHYILGRVRSLDEIKNNIEKSNVDSVLGYLQRNIFKDFTVVTIGPQEVTVR